MYTFHESRVVIEALRLHEFVELARARRKTDATAYMKRHLSTGCDGDNLVFVQRFIGLLVFDADTACQSNKDMYGEQKWCSWRTP